MDGANCREPRRNSEIHAGGLRAGEAVLSAAWLDLLERLGASGRNLREGVARVLQGHGLGEAEMSALWLCRSVPAGLHQAELAARLAVSPAHVSQTVERLRQRGWLTSRRAPPDRRRQYWVVTDDGERLIEQLLVDLAPWAEGEQQRCQGIQRETLFALLERMLPARATRQAA